MERYRRFSLDMLSTLPADDSRGDTVVLVNDGRGEEDCDGEGADDMT